MSSNYGDRPNYELIGLGVFFALVIIVGLLIG